MNQRQRLEEVVQQAIDILQRNTYEAMQLARKLLEDGLAASRKRSFSDEGRAG